MGSFIEDLIVRKYDLNEELLSIKQLFYENQPTEESCYYLAKENFRTWKYRNNFISLDQMMEKTQIDTLFEFAKTNNIKLVDFVYCAEFFVNILSLATFPNGNLCANSETIIDNIHNVLEQINYEIIQVADGYFKIIEKDWKVTEAAESINDKYNLGEKIYLYRHFSMKGKIFDKADILCRLYKVFEQKEKILNANQFSSIASDIGFLADKLDVRHAPDKKQKILIDGFDEGEQEKWYDVLFELFLDMLILCNHIENRPSIKQLKKTLAEIKTDRG